MSFISSFTLRLAVERPVVFQSFSGFASCGIFYNLIKSVDADFAERLHFSKRLAPWAASPIFVESSPSFRIVYRKLKAPSIASISFTIMDSKLCDVFREAILKRDLQIDLVDVKAKVVGVSVNMLKFSDIISNANPIPLKFAVKFLTPTAFRRSIYDCCPYCPHYIKYLYELRETKKFKKPCERVYPCRGIIIPLPIPSLMFRSLARLWSTFSNVNLDVLNAVRWAENAIVVSGFPKGVRTKRVYEHPTSNKWITGFVGTVRFAVREETYNERYAKVAASLLKMAEMTNVGVRRTAGLGMVKYVEPKGGEPS